MLYISAILMFLLVFVFLLFYIVQS